MRIAWVTYDFEEYSSLHVNALVDEHEVLLVTPRPEEGGAKYPIRPEVEHFAFDKPRLRQPLRQLASVRELLRRIDAFQPDVVHFQQGHLWFNFVLKRLRQKYPLVITVHDPRHHAGDTVSKKTPQWVMDHGFRQAHHAIVHGGALAPQVHDLFGVPEERIHVIPHVAMGCGFDGHSNSAAANDDKSILFFGRIYEYKGLEYLIRSQPQVNAAVPNAKFVIGGRGDDFGRYEAMMNDRDRFEVHNRWLSDEERAEMFQQASIVVLPYIEATQSGVVPVAYNYGRPVVATDVGALSECVDDEKTGLLVPPRDVDALANAMIRLLTDDSLRQTMGNAAREKLQQELAPEVVAAQHAAVYEQAIRDFGGSIPPAAETRDNQPVEAMV